MKVSIGISNHHIHLNTEDYKALFGEGSIIEVDRELTQPGMFASKSYVDVRTEKSELKHIRVLGPCREYTQLEITRTDCYKLGIDAPVCESGKLHGIGFDGAEKDAAEVEIVGPCGAITCACAIIAERHIHLTSDMRREYDLADVDTVSVKVSGNGRIKETVFGDVKLKESNEAFFELHLDADDGNGAGLKSGDEGEIIKG